MYCLHYRVIFSYGRECNWQSRTEAGLSRVRRGECDACVHCLWSHGTHKNEANNAAARPYFVCVCGCVCVCFCVCVCVQGVQVKEKLRIGKGKGEGEGEGERE